MAGEREHIGIEKENEYKVNEKRSENKSGYYVKQPTFGTGKPSWIKQQFGKTVAIVVARWHVFFFIFFFCGQGTYRELYRKYFWFRSRSFTVWQSLIC